MAIEGSPRHLERETHDALVSGSNFWSPRKSANGMAPPTSRGYHEHISMWLSPRVRTSLEPAHCRAFLSAAGRRHASGMPLGGRITAADTALAAQDAASGARLLAHAHVLTLALRFLRHRSRNSVGAKRFALVLFGRFLHRCHAASTSVLRRIVRQHSHAASSNPVLLSLAPGTPESVDATPPA
jgi:hypothetical protein